MKQYERYKESGVEWLGRVPEHWEILKMKYAFKERVQKGFPNEPLLSSTQNHGVIPQQLYENRTVVATKDLDKLKLVEVDDFVISLRSFQGGLEYAYFRGIISPAYTVLTPVNIEPEYFRFLGKSNIYIQLLKSCVTGIREGQNIDYNILKENYIPVPSIEEQKAIAHFLDQKCAQIDKAISQKERVIELLNERRQIIIQRAVTRGLDPSVPMKESGVDWIGEIPEHWEVKRLRYLGYTQNGLSKDASYFGKGYPFISYGDVYKSNVIEQPIKGLANSSIEDQKIYSVKENDIFFTRTSETIEEIGFSSVCMNTIKCATFSGFLIRFRPFCQNLIPSFSKYYFRCNIHRLFFVNEMNMVTRASLSQELLKKLPVLLLSKMEQQQLAVYLDQVNVKIDKAISIKRQEIEKLKEYKTVLIDAAVTGKIKIA